MNDPQSEIESLLQGWMTRAVYRGRLNFSAAHIYGTWNYILGIPILIVTALAASPRILEFERAATGWRSVAFSLVRVMIPMLAGLQTFLHLGQRAEKHRLVAAKYGAIKRQMEELLAFHGTTLTQSEKTVSDIRSKLDTLETEEPPIPRYIFLRASPSQHAGTRSQPHHGDDE